MILQNQKLDIIFVHFSLSQKSLGKKKYAKLYNKWFYILKEISKRFRNTNVFVMRFKYNFG
jgi:hypothetical protein